MAATQTPNEWAATDSVPFGSPRRVQPVRSSRFSRCNSISVESIGTRVYQDETGSCGVWSQSHHDVTPLVYRGLLIGPQRLETAFSYVQPGCSQPQAISVRSEEHTSELESRLHLVCRLLR